MKRNILLLILLVPTLALIVLFGFNLLPIKDGALLALLRDAPRLAAGAYLVLFLCLKGYGGPFRPKFRLIHLLWAIPCLGVAIANFPFSALASGQAVIERADLLPLFLVKCLGIALLEESFFRGLLVPLLQKKGDLFAVLVSAALFAAMHLLNLISGNYGAVLLQVGYTFLLGCMFAVMLLFTGNVWLGMLVHFIFDVGGSIVTDLGHGPFQDAVFWGLTAAMGVLCAMHIVVTFVRMKKVHEMNENG